MRIYQRATWLDCRYKNLQPSIGGLDTRGKMKFTRVKYSDGHYRIITEPIEFETTEKLLLALNIIFKEY